MKDLKNSFEKSDIPHIAVEFVAYELFAINEFAPMQSIKRSAFTSWLSTFREIPELAEEISKICLEDRILSDGIKELNVDNRSDLLIKKVPSSSLLVTESSFR